MDVVLCREVVNRTTRDGKMVEDVFQVVKRGGKVIAEWPATGQAFDSVEDLKAAGILNRHELELLKYGVGGA